MRGGAMVVLAVLVVACTGEGTTSERPPERAADGATDDPGAVDPGGETAEPDAEPSYRVTLRRADLDLDGLDATVPDEVLDLAAIDSIDGDWSVAGTVRGADSPAAPVVFRSAGGVDDWDRSDIELPAPYSSAHLLATDHSDFYVLNLQASDGTAHAGLVSKREPFELDTIIDTADSLAVLNVVEAVGGRLAVGWAQREDGTDTAAAWIVGSGGVEEVVLPDDPVVTADLTRLTAAARYGGQYHLFGVNDTTREVFLLQGDELDELAVADLPTAFDDAEMVITLVEALGVLWLGGATKGQATGTQAIWSFADGEWRDRTDEVRPEGHTEFSSRAQRLVFGRWIDGGPYVAVVDGGETWWWNIREGGVIDRSGHMGGGIAAYQPEGDTGLAYDTFGHRWFVDYEEGEVALPTISSAAGLPYVQAFDNGRYAVHFGVAGDARTALLDQQSEVIDVLEGTLRVSPVADLEVAVGERREDVSTVATLVELGDEGGTLVDVPLPQDASTTRLQATFDVDGTPYAVGHAWRDGALHPLILARDGDGWREAELPGLGESRGLLAECGDAVLTFDAVLGYALGWIVDGTFTEQALDDTRFGSLFRCTGDDDGRAWVAGPGLVVAFDADGEVAVHEAPELRYVQGIEVLDLDGRAHLAVLGRDRRATGRARLWLRALDGEHDWFVTEPFDELLDVRTLAVIGSEGETLHVTGTHGTTPPLWHLDVAAG